MTSEPDSAPAATGAVGPRSSPAFHRAVLPLLLAGPLLSAMDAFIVNLAIPSLRSDLGADDGSIQLIIAGYAMIYGVGMITGGRLGDMYGRRRMFAWAMTLFTLASLACGSAPTTGFLLGARIAQGAAAALMVPQALALISTIYRDEARARAIKWYGFTAGLGAVLGQVISGLLIEANVFGLDWRACFLVNLPIGAVAVTLVLRLVPESRAPGRSRLDLAGVALVTLALLAMLVPLTVGRERGWPTWTWSCLAAAVPLLLVFGLHQHQLRDRGGSPLVGLHLFRERAFSVGLACQLVFWSGQASYYLVLGLFVQLGHGLGALGGGLIFVVVNLGFMTASLLVGRASSLLGRQVITAGAALRISGLSLQFLIVAWIGVTGDIGWLVPCLFLDGFGMGLAVAPMVTTILARVQPGHVGAASGVLTTSVQVGSAIGVAIIGLFFYGALDTNGGANAYPHAFSTALLYLIGVCFVLILLVQLLPKRSETT